MFTLAQVFVKGVMFFFLLIFVKMKKTKRKKYKYIVSFIDNQEEKKIRGILYTCVYTSSLQKTKTMGLF